MDVCIVCESYQYYLFLRKSVNACEPRMYASLNSQNERVWAVVPTRAQWGFVRSIFFLTLILKNSKMRPGTKSKFKVNLCIKKIYLAV